MTSKFDWVISELDKGNTVRVKQASRQDADNFRRSLTSRYSLLRNKALAARQVLPRDYSIQMAYLNGIAHFNMIRFAPPEYIIEPIQESQGA